MHLAEATSPGWGYKMPRKLPVVNRHHNGVDHIGQASQPGIFTIEPTKAEAASMEINKGWQRFTLDCTVRSRR